MKKTIILFLLIALFCGSAISCSQVKEENDPLKEWDSMTKEEQEELLFEMEMEGETNPEGVKDEKSLLPPPITSEQWDVIFWIGVGIFFMLIVGGVFLFGKKKE